MADNRPVILLVSAGDCSACANFEAKGIWPRVEARLKNSGRVRVLDVKTPTLHSISLGPQWPVSLKQLVGFYPSILLINGNAWNAAMQNKNLPLQAMVFGGRWTGTNMEPDQQNPPSL